jgi:hypothetical protein
MFHNLVPFAPKTSLSALMLNYVLYRSKLVPRWLSGWGLIGAVLYLASGFLPLIGYDSRSTIYVILEAPLGVCEMVFAVWLIVKGFNPSAITPESTYADVNEISDLPIQNRPFFQQR